MCNPPFEKNSRTPHIFMQRDLRNHEEFLRFEKLYTNNYKTLLTLTPA